MRCATLAIAERHQRRVELSGRQARTATGGSRPTCHLVPRSLTATTLARLSGDQAPARPDSAALGFERPVTPLWFHLCGESLPPGRFAGVARDDYGMFDAICWLGGRCLGASSEVPEAISTRFRPFVLAVYSARSAARWSWSPSIACSGRVATPMLAVR